MLVAGLVPWTSHGGPVLSIAHRGNSLYAPENTLAAFRAAEGVADLVETDVRVSSDGRLVLMHDATVDRTTDGTGAVAGLTLAQLRALDAGSWFSPVFAGERVPTLEEMVTATLPFATPLIEHKAGTAAQIVDELRRLDAVSRVVVQSFDWAFLAAAHALEPTLRLGALGSGNFTAAQLTNIINSGATIVAWEKASVTPAMVAAVHQAGLALYVWTVDSPAEIRRFTEMGVEGIISNDPAAVRGLTPPATNAPAYIGDRLVAYWKLDDGLTDAFATVVSDSRGTNTATLVRRDGASHWLGSPTARFGSCVKLEGTNAFIVVPPSDTLDIHTNALTLAGWVRLTQLPSQLATSYGAIFDSTNDCYVLYLDRGNKELRFKVTDTNGHAARPGIPEVFLQTNQWLHVVATYDGAATPAAGRAAIYLNGELMDVHTGSDSTTPVGLTAPVKTGQAAALGREGPNGGNHFTGLVDDLALWRRALSALEVRQLFEAGQAGRSLGDLLQEPTPLIQFVSVRLPAGDAALEICFRNLGPWQTFRLLRAESCTGPFQPVAGLTPEQLGDGLFRFVCPAQTPPAGFFRVAVE